MTTDCDWAPRVMRETDRPFVVSSWLKSYRVAMPDFPNQSYYKSMARRIERLEREGASIVVAADNDNTDYIVGWVCFGPAAGVVHYLYVREIERGRGTAGELIRSIKDTHEVSEIIATHITQYLEAIARQHPEIRVEPSWLERKTREKNQTRIGASRHGNQSVRG